MVQASTLTITKLAQVIGILVSSFPGVQFGQLHYSTLEMEKNAALKSNKGNFDAVIALSSEGKAELKWWIDNVDKAYNPVMHDNPEVEIHTDASNTGWGAVCADKSTQGLWSIAETVYHINELEMKAVLNALKSFAPFQGKHVKILSDNNTTVCYVNNMGGTKSPSCLVEQCETL